MAAMVQAATTTYASRVKSGNTPLILPSAATVARHRSLVTGTPLAVAPSLQPRPSFRSNSRMNDDDDDDDEEDDDGLLDVDSEDGKKDKEDEDLIEERGGFVLGPPPEALIQRRPAMPTRHIYRYFLAMRSELMGNRTDVQMENAALAEDVMIPIRLDIDIDSCKIKDAFMWNMNGSSPPCYLWDFELIPWPSLVEELVTPDQFANIMCLDLDIPPLVFAPQISTAIRTQIEEYAPVAEIQIPEETEMRVIVSLQLHLGKHLLRDQFEWNLSADDITPEKFSKLLCQDLSLSSGKRPTPILYPYC
jgi:chromatin structure-remodeling complex subunit SFH1